MPGPIDKIEKIGRTNIDNHHNKEQWWYIKYLNENNEVDEDKAKDLVNNITNQINGMERTSVISRKQSLALACAYKAIDHHYYNLFFQNKMKVTPQNTNVKQHTFNIMQTCVDSYVIQITMDKPKPKFLTSGAKRALQKQSKQLNKFVNGIIKSYDFDAAAEMAVLDGAVFGLGCIHVDEFQGKFNFKRVKAPVELIYDYEDARKGKPTVIHYQYLESKEDIMYKYPEHAEKISNIEPFEFTRDSEIPLILIRKSWRLPSTKDADNGRFVISAGDDVVLDYKKYNKDYFPFLFYRHEPNIDSFNGKGMTEILAPNQELINNLCKIMFIGLKVGTTPQVFIDEDAFSGNYSPNHPGVVKMKKNARPPTFKNGNIASEQVFKYLEQVIERAFKESGVSELYAAAQKPGGLSSGKALREYKNAVSQRFVKQIKGFEKLYEQVANMIVDVGKDSPNKIKSHVSDADDSFLEEINFDEIDTNNVFQVQITSASRLSDTPAGKTQEVVELFNVGVIDETEFKDLLDMPDTDKFANLSSASISLIESQLESIVDGEVGVLPTPTVDLTVAMKLAYTYYNRYFNVEDISEESKTALLEYGNKAKEYLDDLMLRQMQQQQMQQMQQQQPQQ